jgi:hypothetical protein
MKTLQRVLSQPPCYVRPMLGIESPFHQMSQQWQYALIFGVLALPITALSYWQTGSELSLSPVFLGGVLPGYLMTRRTGTGRGVGARVGLVGGLPVLWVLFDILQAASALAGPSWFVASATILTIVVTVIFGFGLAALIGELGGKLGSWVASKRSGHSTPTVDL